MKLPHTSGRRGAARTLEELKKQSPDGKVTRTQLFVAIHTINDGTCPFPDARPTLDEITRLVTLKPYLAHRDLDNDPVALKCHRDGKGRVLGYGGGVSKTVINAAAPYREIVEREKRKREDTETNFSVVMERLDEETKARKILEKLAHLADLSASDNQAGQCSTTPSAETHAFPQSTCCLVKSFRNKTLALGNVRTDVMPENDSYQIRIVDIFDHSAELYEGGTFEDIRIGSTIMWPKHSIELI
ncbi:hypothetical protein ACHQM5_020651 [Ranunculus cassubicifolius]